MIVLKFSSRLLGALLLVASGGLAVAGEQARPSDKVSYSTQIRPIFQANCQGCHQPSKAGGGYVMTSFEQMAAGGESKARAIEPKQPELSHLLDQITPRGGKAEMPKGSHRFPTRRSSWLPPGSAREPSTTPRPALQLITTRTIPRFTPARRSSERSTSLPTEPSWPLADFMKSCSGRPTDRAWSLGW